VILLTSYAGLHSLAQITAGFNYQAVARDSDGNVLPSTSLVVQVGIINGTDLIWQEEHTVETSALGLFTLYIGDEQASRTGGTVH